MDGHRRYAEDPDPQWYSTPAPYAAGLPDPRPDDEVRYPLTGGVDSLAPASAAPDETYTPGYSAYSRTDDPLTGGVPADTGARAALDAVRVPLRGPEYPAVRPVEPPPAVTSTTTGSIPVQRTAGSGGHAAAEPTPFGGVQPGATTYPPPVPSSPAYAEPTAFVPPVGVRTADGPAPGDGVYRTRRPVSSVLIALVTAVLMIPVVRLLVDASFADRPTAGGIVPAVLATLGLPLTGIGLYAVAGLGRAPDRAAWSRPPVGYLAVGLVLLVAAALATA